MLYREIMALNLFAFHGIWEKNAIQMLGSTVTRGFSRRLALKMGFIVSRAKPTSLIHF